MKYLIGNMVINSDHIVCVEYDPERSGTDDDTNTPYHFQSRIAITLSAIERDVEAGFEGRIDGVGSKSQIIIWRGSVADAFWDVYSKDAYAVVV